MDLAENPQAQDTLMEMADGLLSGKGADTQTMRYELAAHHGVQGRHQSRLENRRYRSSSLAFGKKSCPARS